MNKIYNGESETCLGCKRFYHYIEYGAPCDVCSYRIKEWTELREGKGGE